MVSVPSSRLVAKGKGCRLPPWKYAVPSPLKGRKPFCCERKRFNPKEAMIAFNIACYASIMGLIEEAHERLRHAIELDKNIRLLALDDEDLRPFVGLDRWLRIVGRALSSNGIPRRAGGETRGMSSAGLFPLHKEVFELGRGFSQGLSMPQNWPPPRFTGREERQWSIATL